MNQTPAVIVNIQRQPGANTIEVVDRIKSLFPRLRQSLPPGVVVSILTDRTNTIRASVDDVHFELLLTVVLVVMVIFLFLRSFSATVIPSIAVPVSIIGTFGGMYMLGFSLNNLSLMALTISTGFVVDDAIVMIENITRYIEEGEAPFQAALKGSAQIGFTILSLSISLIAVLIPLLFMGDVVGRLFREFAITLSITIVISAIVSLTLTPMMCAYLLKHKPASKQSWFYRTSEKIYEDVIAWYGITLKFVLRFQFITLLIAIGTLVATILLYIYIPKGFFPVQDTGVILGISEAPQSISFSAMSQKQQELAKIILQDPAVDSLSSFIGIDGTNITDNSGRIQINLKPLPDTYMNRAIRWVEREPQLRPDQTRTLSASDVIRRLQPELEQVTGITLYMQPVQDLTVEDRVSRTEYQYSLGDPDAAELSLWVPKFLAKLKSLPQLADVASDQLDSGLQVRLVINRDTASRLGITPQMIDDALYDAYGQRQASIMFTQLNQYHVVLGVPASYRNRPSDLSQMFIRSTGGMMVPMSEFVTQHQESVPLVISHQAQFPTVTVSFNLANNVSLGEAVKAINQARNDLNMPASIETGFEGTAAAFEASLTNEPLLILAALVVVYIVLGVLYESYIHPITILSTLPSAGVGALLALMFCGESLSVVALIGIILLIGIVKKNAIMMIDFALEAEREQGKSPYDAIYQACLLRFRPIMMTTMAALLGGVPLALGGGMGAELRRPLGISIVGGLIFSQVLTLYTTPVIYLYFDRLARYIRPNRKKEKTGNLFAGVPVPESAA